jgi:phage shock protein C
MGVEWNAPGISRVLQSEADVAAAEVIVPARMLHRSRTDKMIGGVCGGLAHWVGWNVTTVRLAYVLVSVLSAAFPGILVYLVLWLIMPLEDREVA